MSEFWVNSTEQQVPEYTFPWRFTLFIPSSWLRTTVIENRILAAWTVSLTHKSVSWTHRYCKKPVVSQGNSFVACTWKSIVRFFSALDGWTWLGALECRRRGGPMMTPSPGFLCRLPARLLQRVRNSWGSSNPESSRMHSGKDPLLHKLLPEFKTANSLCNHSCVCFVLGFFCQFIQTKSVCGSTSRDVIHSDTFQVFSLFIKRRGDFVSFPSNQEFNGGVLRGPPLPTEQT